MRAGPLVHVAPPLTVTSQTHDLTATRAVRINRFGGPEVLGGVDLPDPDPSEGQRLYEVRTAAVNFADTHQGRSAQRTL
jgi:hypothetical protein